MSLVIFTVSDEIFSGFMTIINMEEVKTIDDICTNVKNQLINYLTIGRMRFLVEKAREKKFHIHNITIEQLLNGERTQIYVCTHCYQNPQI